VDDVELDQDVAFGRFDGFANGVESRLAGGVQLQIVAVEEGNLGQGFIDRLRCVGAFPRGQFPDPGDFVVVADEPVEFLDSGSHSLDVTVEFGASEYPVQGQGNDRERDEGDGPGDGSLRRPRVMDGEDCRDDAGNFGGR